jgi:diguanylate cyclase (GGDEF)-like protein
MLPKSWLAKILFGAQPKLQRMLRYWAATGLLYSVCGLLILVQVCTGVTEPAAGASLVAYGMGGAAFFYLLVRRSEGRIAPTTLAVLQGLFGITCNMWVYAISGPLRGACLLMLLVVIAFCTFALRPRQTLLLSAAGLVGMGGTMGWLAATDPLHFPPHVEALSFGYMAAALLAITLLTGEMNKLRARLKHQKEELQAAVARIRTLATLDDLTALANRRYMNEVLEAEERRQGARGGSTCIALLDIDFFKHVNDSFGHAAGDAVLRAFAEAARVGLRSTDVLARWGGEEFLLLLPDTALAEAERVLKRIADQVGAMQVPGVDLGRKISFSVGLAARIEHEAFADTINRADKSLYTAKAMGRNRLIVA